MLAHSGVQLDFPVIFADYKFVASSMHGGLRLAGTAEFAGLARPPDYRRAHAILRNGQRALPRLAAAEMQLWMGARPTLPDSLPVIGHATGNGAVYYAFGHQHLGLTLAPVTGRLIAQLVSGAAPDIDLAPYAADRFRRPSARP